MKPNLIILTPGLSGSSVVAGLIGKAGYWTGESTFEKADYDTNENLELVRLNKALLERAGVGDAFTDRYDDRDRQRIDAIADAVDPEPYRQFVRHCAEHSPWVWKDPRLTLTIHYWVRHLDLVNDVRFLFLTRNHLQHWISVLNRRQIQTYRYCARYHDAVEHSIASFIEQSGAHCLNVLFDDLVVTPERVIASLNDFLGTTLTLEDLRAVYNKPLYQPPRGFVDLGKALAIYAKNYRLRLR